MPQDDRCLQAVYEGRRTVAPMRISETFRDRNQAGRELAESVSALLAGVPAESVVVLGIPRGGVPVAAAVSRRLGAALDVVLVRKLGVPTQPELAMGAVGEGGVVVENRDVMREFALTPLDLESARRREEHEIERRVRMFRGDRPAADVRDKVVVVVDDGIATGSTAQAACRVLRARGASRIVLAVPVAPGGWRGDFASVADDLVCLSEPKRFMSVGQFYEDFEPVDDRTVIDVVNGIDPLVDVPVHDEEFSVDVDGTQVCGLLSVPEPVGAVVVFAHGSGSGRHSPRNRFVAAHLRRSGIATVLVDLVSTVDPEADTGLDVLVSRLWRVVQWVGDHPGLCSLPIGLVGSSSGAAVALLVAARHPGRIGAVVGRGGRPDLADDEVVAVKCPVLLIVGTADRAVLGLNQSAARRMRNCSVVQVDGAGHLFEEPGTLQEAARLAGGFLRVHLG